ncbi:hypothetical protein NKH95_10965 [Mesorhizobium sp. M0848]|uniref:hypothetical protein n=1 Tax=Mesorhizobium sp. M0848 TaxID=2957012 RepID=UPI00333776D6
MALRTALSEVRVEPERIMDSYDGPTAIDLHFADISLHGATMTLGLSYSKIEFQG